MTTPTLLRNATIFSGLAAAFLLGSARPGFQAPASVKVDKEMFLVVVEYRTPTKLDIPLPSATENVLIYQVPAGKRVRLQSYLLPLGIPEGVGNPLSPLGIGVMQGEKNAVPKTVAFGNSYDLIRIEPGIVFDSGAKMVARFDSTVKALTGSLFLHGTIEDTPGADAR